MEVRWGWRAVRSARTQPEGQSEAQLNHQRDNFFREITQSSNDGRTSGCIYLSKEAPSAPARIKPAFDKESPQLLPCQPPAHCGNSNGAISTQRIRFLRFCKSEFPVRLRGIYWDLSQQASWSDYHQSGKRSLPGEDLESPINLMHGFRLCRELENLQTSFDQHTNFQAESVSSLGVTNNNTRFKTIGWVSLIMS